MVSPPELSIIMQLTLQSLGFKDPAKLSRKLVGVLEIA